MTSLIDVIFLLLLFFMLSSTFSKFAEVELASGRGGATAQPDSAPYFLSLESGALTLNGQPETFESLPAALAGDREADETPRVLISLRDGVTAQRLTDLLVALRQIEGLSVKVLEAS